VYFGSVSLDEPANGKEVLSQSRVIRFEAQCVAENATKRFFERVSPIHPIARLSRAHIRIPIVNVNSHLTPISLRGITA
jgi:hypothetical protein